MQLQFSGTDYYIRAVWMMELIAVESRGKMLQRDGFFFSVVIHNTQGETSVLLLIDFTSWPDGANLILAQTSDVCSCKINFFL